MKISIERGALLKAVSQAQSVVERRNTIPILANVLIEAEGANVSFRATDLDLVVTVCDDAAENCPAWLGSGKVAHISFPDPARATGTEDERLAVFRRVRDDIRAKVLNYIEETEYTK